MVYHVVERHGDGRFVAGHDVGSGIADQNDVYSGPVEDTGHGVSMAIFSPRLFISASRSVVTGLRFLSVDIVS